MNFSKHWNVLRLVHFMMRDFKGHLTLIVVAGGRTISPSTSLEHVDAQCTLDIRVCPLPGGAKTQDATNKTLRDLLLTRGVRTEDVDARIQMIRAKVSSTELAAMMAMSEQNAWSALKTQANQNKIRLITTAELKEHQKSLRQLDRVPKPSSAGMSSDKPSKKQRATQPQLERKIRIDPAHFQAQGQKVKIIDDTQWGPDGQGVVITTPQVAQKRLPVARLSADYLALIVVTSQPFNGQAPIAVPASDDEGKPILATIVIVNFGDIAVVCKPAVPSTELQAVPTVILEVSVVRQYVVKWDDVRNILNYLGHHLPELRKGQVIASWAFRSYDSKRAKSDHNSAHHVHGYIRVPEQVVHQTLLRSGHAGIFLQAKNENKRPDGRYGVIMLHGMKLEEALQLAASHKQALGIVQLGASGVFALRAKREDIQTIRQAVHPQSISIQEGAIPSGATWWVLKNVTVSTTGKDLSEALVKLGWQASVVRPAGKSAWIACSLDDPPATHLCLGADYVSVVPLVKTRHATNQTSQAAAYVPLPANFSMCPEDETGSTTPTSSSTRFTDLRVDLEEKLTTMINNKMQNCDQKIAQVAASVEGVKSELGMVVEHSKKEFNDLREQQVSLHTTIQNNNNGMLTQMQNLFKQMQQELKATLTPTELDDDMGKRTRTS